MLLQVLEDDVFKSGIYTTGFVTKQLVKKIRFNNTKGKNDDESICIDGRKCMEDCCRVGDTVEEEQDVVILNL